MIVGSVLLVCAAGLANADGNSPEDNACLKGLTHISAKQDDALARSSRIASVTSSSVTTSTPATIVERKLVADCSNR